MAAFVVIDRVRPHADTGILPVDKVCRDCVVPVLKSVYSTPRAPLIVQMPCSLVISKTVRVTGKTGHRLYMVFLAVVRCLDTIIEICDFIRALQHSVALFESPLFQGSHLLRIFFYVRVQGQLFMRSCYLIFYMSMAKMTIKTV